MAENRFLHLWEPREIERQLRTIPRYLKRTTLFKLAVGTLVIGLLAVVVVMPLLQSDDSGMRLALSTATPEESSEKPVMQNPRFESTDAQDQPFTVTADTAEQMLEGEVLLTNIDGSMSLKDGGTVVVHAKKGVMKVLNSTLTLEGDVELFTSDGYEFHAQTAFLDLKAGTATTTDPVHGKGPPGAIESNRFELSGRGDGIRFLDNVKLTLYP